MKRIIALGASNSKESINKKFAVYAAHKVEQATVSILDLNDFEFPLYGPDLEKEIGIPENVKVLDALIADSDGIVLSMAEYNGSYTTAFKNVFDWLSRLGMKVWKEKPILLLATSPGGRGAASVLRTAKDMMPFFGGHVIADFSLPLFYENFTEDGLTDQGMNQALNEKIRLFQEAL